MVELGIYNINQLAYAKFPFGSYLMGHGSASVNSHTREWASNQERKPLLEESFCTRVQKTIAILSGLYKVAQVFILLFWFHNTQGSFKNRLFLKK